MSERRQQQKFVLPYGTYKNEEDDDSDSSPQGREKDWDSLRGNFGNRTRRYQHGGYEHQPPHLLKEYGYMEKREVQKYQDRHTPYAVQHNKRGMKLHNEGRKPLEREMENTQDEITGRWFKITIPYGSKYDKTWLMDSIQSHCSVPFTPVEFHYVKNRVQFFVQDARAAYALKDVSYQICDEENWKIAIFVNTSAVPYSVRDKLAPEEMEQLKLAMRKRYDISQKALDLRSLLYDPGFAHLDIDIILNRRNCMAATLQVIEENFPELLSLNLRNNRLYQLDGLSDITQMVPTVKILNLSKNKLKSTWELGKIKGLKLEELWLEGNPLCDNFQSQFTYVSAIRKCFPKLLRLDGQDLPPPITTDIDRPYLVKPLKKESGKGLDDMKTQVLQFLQQYYLIYDSGERQSLLGAYHDEACFSLTIPFIQDNPVTSSLFEYFKDNRNMKNLQDPNLRFQLLKRTKRDIVSSLCVFPKTQHDLNSFVVDMWLQSEKMLCFCVNGVFKEVEGRSQGSVRAFTRIFIATPASDSSMFIVNDELFVRDSNLNETQKAISIPVPTPSCSTVPTFSQEQQEMVQVFSIQSGMKPQWSQKCLQDNEWNYIKAAQVFATLKTQGKIPEEAFKQIP